jgi:RNA polymerase sigma factor (sigma-70 family)
VTFVHNANVARSGGSRFEREFPQLWLIAERVARHIVHSHADAEDVAAEALARLHAAWDRVGGQPWEHAWLVRVTTNLAIDQIRSRRSYVSSDAHSHVPESDNAVIARLALADALARLPRRQREVVVLRHLAGLSETGVASQLDMTVGSVKRHSHRALSKLRGLLDEFAPDTSGLQ